jgi:hypothetical protein
MPLRIGQQPTFQRVARLTEIAVRNIAVRKEGRKEEKENRGWIERNKEGKKEQRRK